MIISWIIQNIIEIIGAILSLIYLYFSIRQSVFLWPIGLVSSGFYVVVFYSSQLYAEMGLQFYYITVSIYGWYYWVYGNKKSGTKQDADLPVSRLNLSQAIRYGIFFILIYVVLFYFLSHHTNSNIPGWDSFVTAGSLVGTWMLAKKILENWLVWIIVDSLSIGIYIYKDLHPTVVLFCIYSILAILGYIKWKRTLSINTTI